MTIAVSPQSLPALVLNADYRPLSYYPLSLWSWQDAIKAVFLDRVNIIAEYDHSVCSPSFSMRLPSVVSLKTYVQPTRNPAFTRFNVFLRDKFQCQYCGSPDDLTFDHVIPRAHGGKPPGRMSWRRVRPAICARGLNCRNRLICSRPRSPISQACRTCIIMAGRFHPTICMKAGWIISIGIPNCSLKPSCAERPRKRWRRERGWSGHSSRPATGRKSARPLLCRTVL